MVANSAASAIADANAKKEILRFTLDDRLRAVAQEYSIDTAMDK